MALTGAERTSQMWTRLRICIEAIKEAAGCAWCRFKHPCVLQFHHIDPETKSFDISSVYQKNRSWSEIEAEIDKCIILCGNCHLIHEARTRNPERGY